MMTTVGLYDVRSFGYCFREAGPFLLDDWAA